MNGDLGKLLEGATFSHAIAFAAERHLSQLDKSGAPYVLHPIRVAMAVRAEGFSLDHQLAALLHDVLEDTKTEPEEIRARFGDVVLSAVDSVTRREGETYRDFVKRAALHPIGRVVKLFDLFDNSDPARRHPEYPASRGRARALELLRDEPVAGSA